MENKTYTILITTNREGRTKALTVPSSWMKAGVLVVSLVLVFLGALAVDYVGLLVGANENKKLRAENSHLKRQFQMIDNKIASYETQIDKLASLEKRLRMITNIEDSSRTLKLAIGPLPKAGQNFPGQHHKMAQRDPSSEFAMHGAYNDEDHNHGGLQMGLQSDLLVPRKGYESLAIRIDRVVRQTELRRQGLQELWDTLSERESLLNATPSIKPVMGWYTSRFGYRLDPYTNRPIMHSGLDIAAAQGSPVFAPANGVVSFVGYESGYGNLVSIDHGYGVITRYGHNSRVFVQKGQTVSRRDVIASVGSTGRSTGPHLHYEVRVHGVPVDPMNYILDDD